MATATILADLTSRIADALDRGTAPWVRPWSKPTLALPVNGVRGNRYRGFNALLLMVEQDAKGYETSEWATYKAWSSVGGQVRKGEKGTQVTWWSTFEVPDRDGKPGPDGKVRTRQVPTMRLFTVFNRAQVDGLPEVEVPATPTLDPALRLTGAEEALTVAGNRIGVGLQHGGGQASYSPTFHAIRLPAYERFDSAPAYVQTWAHELAHASGHPTCLDRPTLTETAGYGTETYAREELVAELTSALFLAMQGIDDPRTAEQTVAYCKGWSRAIRQDPDMFRRASSEAEKAFAFLFPDEADGADPDGADA